MLAANVTTTDVAIYLGIYASVVSTAAGLWALFSGTFRDRARVTITAHEAYLVAAAKGPTAVRGEDTLKTIGVQPHQGTEILQLVLRNRGRRPARIDSVTQIRQRRKLTVGSWMFDDLTGQVPCDLPAETSKQLILGANGGYKHGDIPTSRFFAVDGAGRKHPLRERYRQRLATAVYGWAVKLHMKRKRRQLRQSRTRS